MDLSAPDFLPGVGMGNLISVTGVGGLVALATTSGAFVAQGLFGSFVYVAAALAVLSEKPDWGGRPAFVFGVLALVVLAAIGRLLAERRTAAAATTAVPSAAASAEQKQAAAAAAAKQGRSGLATQLERLAVVAASVSVGFAWAEWNEVPFSFDRESGAGIAIALVCGIVGALAAHLFIAGSVRAGGAASIVGGVVVITAAVLNVAGFYVPFLGFLALVVAALFAVRLRQRERAKYQGLRILS